jgi:hypothetical protein
LFLAFDEYITQKKKRATIIGFINDDKNNKDIITDWMSSYQLYEDAKSGFNSAFQAAYKNYYPNMPSIKSADFDISVEFTAFQASKSIDKDGMKTFANATNQAAKRLEIRMVCKDQSVSAAVPESSSSSSVPTPPTYRLENNVEIVEPLQNYIDFCKQKSEMEGFFVRSDTHQLL